MAAQHAEPDGVEPEPELIKPEDFLPRDPFPPDARHLGFDRYSGGATARVPRAAALPGRHTGHPVVAMTPHARVHVPGGLTLRSLLPETAR